MPIQQIRDRFATAAWVTIAPVIGGCAYHQTPPVSPAAVTRRFEQPRVMPGLPNFAQVSPALYRGAQPTAEGFRELERMGVRAVVNLRSLHTNRELIAGTNLRYIRIPCSAWDVDWANFRKFLAIVNDPANQPVFVHCQHGSDRTGFLVAGYRLVELEWDCDSAMAELRSFGFHTIWGHIPLKIRTYGRLAPRPAA